MSSVPVNADVSTLLHPAQLSSNQTTFKKEDPTKHGFSDLSGELRNIIYKLVLTRDVVIALDLVNGGREYYEDNNIVHPNANITPSKSQVENKEYRDRKFRPTLDIAAAILRICKAIHLEAGPILVSHNTFSIDTQHCMPKRHDKVFQFHPCLLTSWIVVCQLVIRVRAPYSHVEWATAIKLHLYPALGVFKTFVGQIEASRTCTIELYNEDGWSMEPFLLPQLPWHSSTQLQLWDDLVASTLSIVHRAGCDTPILIRHVSLGHVPEELWAKVTQEIASANAKKFKLNPKAAIFIFIPRYGIHPEHTRERQINQLPLPWSGKGQFY